jgi:N-acetylglucosaminyldiphosphoundecaprenol N-acetyl-beta-D-mannosaminyltransferase
MAKQFEPMTSVQHEAGEIHPRRVGKVLDVDIDVLRWDEALDRVHAWASRGESRYVCIVNAHSVVTARQDPRFCAAIADSDMATPDGAPVAWMLRRQGHDDQQPISGPDLMLKYCAAAAGRNEPIFLLGGTEQTLARLQRTLPALCPGLRIAGAISPPFRRLTPDEDARIVDTINASGAGTVWVGLGCPKQELWMAEHRGRVRAVMLGVGAAFDFHAGTIPRAPLWMRRRGLEWLHRLFTEPRRLWKRYLVTNTLFIVGAVRQLATRAR